MALARGEGVSLVQVAQDFGIHVGTLDKWLRHMGSALAVSALNTAVARRHINDYDVTGCIVHSDRGAQFRSSKYLRELKNHGLVGSMGRVGSAGDNAAMESFFSLLQRNVLNTNTWASRKELTIAVITWIERRYHQRRRQKRLGRLTPLEYETINKKAVSKAAWNCHLNVQQTQF